MQSMDGGTRQPDPRFSRFGLSFRLTRAVKWLLIIHGAVFALELVIGHAGGKAGQEFLFENLSLSFDRCLFEGKVWQVLTYMLLHDPFSIAHILWNMLILWMFGSPLESFWGGRRFLRFYFFTGLFAGGIVLLSALMIPSQRQTFTLGASGALYALLVAFGFNFPNSPIYLFGLFPIKGKHLVMLFIGLGVAQSLTLGGTNVSIAAHFGGMLAGFLLVTGAWRPSKIVGWIRLWWMKRRYKKLRKRFQVIDRDKPGGGYLN
ncbi:MAG: rhomboid family intramembrane serine protease [Deltaproteobacteria bacterium]|nr:rhomboid family intramembrane serine protease [Deltaproteobacteria bacterium]